MPLFHIYYIRKYRDNCFWSKKQTKTKATNWYSVDESTLGFIAMYYSMEIPYEVIRVV